MPRKAYRLDILERSIKIYLIRFLILLLLIKIYPLFLLLETTGLYNI